jgi:hypothetical protein
MKRFVTLVILGVLFAALAVIGFALWAKPSVPGWFSAVSKNNGYDPLLQAASKVKGKAPDETSDVTAFVTENEAAIQEIRLALTLPFEVPLAGYSPTNDLVRDFGKFKAVGLTLRAKGRFAEDQKAFAKAAEIYVEVIQLGQRLEHGPLVALVTGVLIEHLGLEAIEKIYAQLPSVERNGSLFQKWPGASDFICVG